MSGTPASMAAPNAGSGARLHRDRRNPGDPGGQFATSDIGDAPVLPELLDEITRTADRQRHRRRRLRHPQVPRRHRRSGCRGVIPPRKNAKPWKPDTAGAVARNGILHLEARRADHMATMERLSSPKPCRDKMHCVKLLGQRLSARNSTVRSRIPGARCRLNGFAARNTRHRGRRIGLSGKGKLRPSADLCNKALMPVRSTSRWHR